MKRAITPGTFDPITLGHLDIISRANRLFDETIVAVAQSPQKNTLFSLEERTELARQACAGFDSVKVEAFDGLLVDFAREKQANILVKGLRAITDFEYEFQMATLNYKLADDIETAFIMSPPQYMYLSSSVVRELAGLKSPVDEFVPEGVSAAIKKKFNY